MILSYKDKLTEDFANGKRIKDFENFAKQAEKRLEILDAAPNKEALRHLPSNNFEALGGKRKGYFSIRINRQWRICFEWPDGELGPSNVEIIDYH